MCSSKSLLVLALLLCTTPAFAQRTDGSANCGTAGGTSLGQNWTLNSNACVGQTANTSQSSTETSPTYGITSGQLVVTFGGSCDTESVAGGCSGGPYTAAPLYITDADSHVQAQGTVTVSGTTMTLTGGDGWSVAGCHWSSGCDWLGR